MKISIGADHNGFVLKQVLIASFSQHSWCDVGSYNQQRDDYPIYAQKVCNDVLSDACERGVLICGTGTGMAIAANRFAHIYAAVCWNEEVARHARSHDGCNVLVLPACCCSEDVAKAIFAAWMATPFTGGRYEKRLHMIDESRE